MQISLTLICILAHTVNVRFPVHYALCAKVLSFDTRLKLGVHVLFIACYFRLYFSDKDRLTRLTSKE